ncbi:cation:proton antiporter domain-containing protein [Thiocapsa bogorovii]|uniref:cation:proton antiporter domain-containing protein n=1 Tax=Thiocapsa bogorovii TaxID=521689 RepID=UPI001E474CB2|nr:cation:proton antiporter [Thiocapsa bogorovii]UHD14926.1 cation:proton antiporter [Thiocapsa bogorovii]
MATGRGPLTFTIVVGSVIVMASGKGPVQALEVAVALTFSSTIIIVKLLSDKGEPDALHGRIAIGVVIVQDIAVVLAVMAMSALSTGADVSAWSAPISLGGRIHKHPVPSSTPGSITHAPRWSTARAGQFAGVETQLPRGQQAACSEHPPEHRPWHPSISWSATTSR